MHVEFVNIFNFISIGKSLSNKKTIYKFIKLQSDKRIAIKFQRLLVKHLFENPIELKFRLNLFCVI